MRKYFCLWSLVICGVYSGCATDTANTQKEPVRHSFNRGGEGTDSQGLDANSRYHEAAGNSNNIGGGFGAQSRAGIR